MRIITGHSSTVRPWAPANVEAVRDASRRGVGGPADVDRAEGASDDGPYPDFEAGHVFEGQLSIFVAVAVDDRLQNRRVLVDVPRDVGQPFDKQAEDPGDQ